MLAGILLSEIYGKKMLLTSILLSKIPARSAIPSRVAFLSRIAIPSRSAIPVSLFDKMRPPWRIDDD